MSKTTISGRKILITGASSGIGRAGALQLAAEGAQVLLTARRADELASLVSEITAGGGQAQAYPIDLTDNDAVDALMHFHLRCQYSTSSASRKQLAATKTQHPHVTMAAGHLAINHRAWCLAGIFDNL